MGMRLGSWMLGAGARLVWETELYLGLLIFMGYVVYDTQVIVERAEAGDRDEIGAALGLFVDALAIFVRVLVLLMRSGQNKSEQREARRGGRQPHRSRVH
ncbi:hypothetical protein H632_c230p2 [Helicosporidium sp. ATCC 50920]|nr:hypothetical protein H632_c230p2 [Helicosporidium sp. ATCC 50920]|eukprot:KDD76425.1 hypothetical protein H632_c230p2 [Helicosporidium sp. ATCC 50920]